MHDYMEIITMDLLGKAKRSHYAPHVGEVVALVNQQGEEEQLVLIQAKVKKNGSMPGAKRKSFSLLLQKKGTSAFDSGEYTLRFGRKEIGPLFVNRIHPGHHEHDKEALFQIIFN